MSQLGWVVANVSPLNANYQFITNGSRIVFVSFNYAVDGLVAYYSDDGGTTWSTLAIPNLIWADAAEIGGAFSLVSSPGPSSVLHTTTSVNEYSTDLLAWSQEPMPFPISSALMGFTLGSVLIRCDHFSYSTVSTTDGVTWTPGNAPTLASPFPPLSSGSYRVDVRRIPAGLILFATEGASTQYDLTADGVTWTTHDLASFVPASTFIQDFIPLADGVVAVLGTAAYVSYSPTAYYYLYSSDGVTWAPIAIATYQQLQYPLTVGSLTLISVNDIRTGTSQHPLYSRGGTPLSPLPLPNGSGFDVVGLSLIGTTYVISGYLATTNESYILTSADGGISWSGPVIIASDSSWAGGTIYEVDGQWVNFGGASSLLYATSSDGGATWDQGPVPIGSEWALDIQMVGSDLFLFTTSGIICHLGVVNGDVMAMLV